jgi:hypothetical protein
MISREVCGFMSIVSVSNKLLDRLSLCSERRKDETTYSIQFSFSGLGLKSLVVMMDIK